MLNSNFWYSPITLFKFGAEAMNGDTSREISKKIEEVIPVAVACAGLHIMTGQEWWMQPVPDTEQSPDVRVMYLDKPEGSNRQNILDIEVVTKNNYSTDVDLANFILKTKLDNPKKAYDNKTAIVCFLNHRLTTSWLEVHQKLKATNKQNNVYIVACVSKEQQKYHLVQVHPTMDVVIEVDMRRLAPYHAPAIYMKREGSIFTEGNIQASNPFLN